MMLIQKSVILTFCACCFIAAAHSSEQSKERSVKTDVERLYSANSAERADAAGRLAEAGPSTISPLVSVVCDKEKPHFDVAWPMAAKILGDLKAAAAAPCLVELLMEQYPSIGPVNGKSDDTLTSADPAFAALVRIGTPAVPAIRRRLRFLGPNSAIMALRALRAINSASAREAVETYIKDLQDQLGLARQVLQDFNQPNER